MNKFYFLSAILHIFFIAIFLFFSKEKEVKFKEKKTMIVSIKNKKAVSSKKVVNLNSEKTISKLKNEITETNKTIQNSKKIKKNKVQNLKSKENKKKSTVKEYKSQKNTQQYNEFEDNNKFLKGKDGVFTAISLDGIEYQILKEIDPKYPIRAKKLNYRGIGSIRVKFLVDIDGKIKKIEFLSGENKFGFIEEVEKALKQWKFKPIEYKNKRIRVYFEKEFKFVEK